MSKKRKLRDWEETLEVSEMKREVKKVIRQERKELKKLRHAGYPEFIKGTPYETRKIKKEWE